MPEVAPQPPTPQPPEIPPEPEKVSLIAGQTDGQLCRFQIWLYFDERNI